MEVGYAHTGQFIRFPVNDSRRESTAFEGSSYFSSLLLFFDGHMIENLLSRKNEQLVGSTFNVRAPIFLPLLN